MSLRPCARAVHTRLTHCDCRAAAVRNEVDRVAAEKAHDMGKLVRRSAQEDSEWKKRGVLLGGM